MKPLRPDFEIYFNMLKAISAEDGRVYIAGVASDPSLDLDGEVVDASGFPLGVDYLKKWGKFNWNHATGLGAVIGNVTNAGFISKSAAKSKYGVDINGTGVEIEGWLPPLSLEPDNPYLKEFHRMAKSGYKLGFSMHGRYAGKRMDTTDDGREVLVATPGFVSQVAITPGPKNSNAVCLVKSLSAAITPREHGEEDPWPLYICPDLGSLEKALETTGIIPTQGVQGGDTLKVQDLGGGRGGTRRRGRVRTAEISGLEIHDDEEDDDHEGETLADMKKSLGDLIFSTRLLMQAA